ncbi:hypothetical protein EGW08_020830, partial [Elysia chlorotica]
GDARLASAAGPSEALHSALLRTLHEVGDPRLLREFYRAQRDDFPGHVDVEKYDPPPPPPPPKQVSPPKANVTPVKDSPVSKAKAKPSPVLASSPPAKKPPKVGVTNKKSGSCSPAKPQPCRVATPIPQFPLGQRTSHMTSFIHHPMSHHQHQQRLHHHHHQQQQQEQQKQSYPSQQPLPQQAHTHHPQPIKVTPYSPGPAFIYQFVSPPPPPSPSPSPLGYSLGGAPSPAPHGDFQSSFTLNHMGTLSLGRRGVNPYDQAYNSAMQPVGLGFPSYYPASIQALHQPQNTGMPSLSNLSGLQGLQNLPNLPSLGGLGGLQSMGVQQFPLVQPAPVMAHQQLPHDMAQFSPLRSPTFSPFSSRLPPGTRDGSGFARPQPMMPPPAHCHKPSSHSPMGPPPTPLHAPSSRPASSPHRQHQHQHQQNHFQHHQLQHQHQQQQSPSTSPIESLRSMNPQGVQPILQSHVLQFSNPAAMYPHPHNIHALSQQVAAHQHVSLAPKPMNTAKVTSSSPQARKQQTNNTDCHFVQTPPTQCKKELSTDTANPSCDITPKPSTCNAEVQTKLAVNRRVSTEGADISDLLHSAHNAMFETDGGTPPAGSRDSHQHPLPTSSSSSSSSSSSYSSENCSSFSAEGQAKSSVSSAASAAPSFNTAYSMSSILDLPCQKLKSEPQVASSSEFAPPVMQNSFSVVVNSPTNLHIAFPSNVTKRTGSDQSNLTNLTVVKKEQEEKLPVKQEKHPVKQEEPRRQEPSSKKRKAGVIIIVDSEESSEDEPLAKLIKRDAPQKPAPPKPEQTELPSKEKVVKKPTSSSAKPKKTVVKVKPSKPVKVSPIKAKKPVSPMKLKVKKFNKTTKAVEAVASPIAKDVTTAKPKVKGKKAAKSSSAKPKKPAAKKAKVDVHPNVQPLPRPINNHGWSWIGDGFVGPVPKLTIAREEQVRMRRCFNSMRHTSGEVVTVGDCVLLQSDGTDSNVPYVARVTRLWETLNGEKMFSMLWYYQPEHTATGREPEDGEQELFASKHREENSVACIDDKCYVLMYNEYCRLEAEAARNDQGVQMPRWREEMPGVSAEDQPLRRRPPPSNACVDNIWFCRYDYDIRKKYVRKPKHKKSSLRYRAPCKLV